MSGLKNELRLLSDNGLADGRGGHEEQPDRRAD
jgi:hypothetical protein